MRDVRNARRATLVGGVAAVISVLYAISPPAARADVPLSPVQDLVATVTGDVATVTWQAPATGSVARYQVHALLGGPDGSDYGTRITSMTSIQWDRLPFNQPVTFTVTPIGPDGPGYASGPAGPVNETGTVTPADTYCPTGSSGDCVVVATSQGLGPETHPGSGILNDPMAAGNPYAAALHLTHWRLPADDPGILQAALAYVPSTGLIENLSDAWFATEHYQSFGHTYVVDPWLDWNFYDNFVASLVRQAVQNGQDPYWDIQNEPENYPYATLEPANRDRVEQQYLHAYNAIKSVDPNAKVIGPSIDWMYENSAAPWWIDMKSFIPFAAANAMKLTAISWHDNAAQTDSYPTNYLETPQSERDHAAEVRELIAENPGIGTPALMVDENSSAAGQFVPGWQAGYLAEEDRAGIALAERACWAYPAQASGLGGCDGPYLDELLNQDLSPSSSYWTTVDYAAMNGTRVWSATNDADLSSLAVTDGTGTTRLLLGRHVTCSGWTVTSEYCGALTSPSPVPATVDILVPTGATAATVTTQELPNTRADLPTAPAVATDTVPVTGGVVQVTLPSVQDGDAFFLTVTPNSTSGGAPSSGESTVQEVPTPTGAPTPTRMLVEGGDYQSAKVLHTFASPLSVLVTDQFGNAMPNQEVTFGLPGGHASFQTGGQIAQVYTNPVGMATSPPVKAGIDGGGFTSFSYLTQLGAAPPWPSAYFALNVTL